MNTPPRLTTTQPNLEVALIAEIAEEEGLNYKRVAKRFEGAVRRPVQR